MDEKQTVTLTRTQSVDLVNWLRGNREAIRQAKNRDEVVALVSPQFDWAGDHCRHSILSRLETAEAYPVYKLRNMVRKWADARGVLGNVYDMVDEFFSAHPTTKHDAYRMIIQQRMEELIKKQQPRKAAKKVREKKAQPVDMASSGKVVTEQEQLVRGLLNRVEVLEEAVASLRRTIQDPRESVDPAPISREVAHKPVSVVEDESPETPAGEVVDD